MIETTNKATETTTVTADELWLRVAAEIATGARPAGGPYVLSVEDGLRHLTDTEYRIRVALVEDTEHDGAQTRLSRTLSPEEWRRALRAALDETA